jgi:sarcosine oxidase
MVRTSDFAVIGAGVMGSATAGWLATRGASVVLVDQYPRGHTRGGSHGDSRIFRLAYSEPDYVQLAIESLAGWRQLEEECGQALLETTGGVDHGLEVVDTIGGVLGRFGVAFEALGAEAAMARWPGMRFEGEVLFQPDAGRLHADRALAALQTLAERHGATLLFDCRARIDKMTDTQVVVATEQGEIETGVAVVAAGAWAPRLTPPALALPAIRVTHEQPAYFLASPADGWPAFVHYDAGDEGPANRFAGYGLPVPGRGVKVGLHASGEVLDPDATTRPPNPALAEQLADYVAAWLPGLEPHPVPAATVARLSPRPAAASVPAPGSGPIRVSCISNTIWN